MWTGPPRTGQTHERDRGDNKRALYAPPPTVTPFRLSHDRSLRMYAFTSQGSKKGKKGGKKGKKDGAGGDDKKVELLKRFQVKREGGLRPLLQSFLVRLCRDSCTREDSLSLSLLSSLSLSLSPPGPTFARTASKQPKSG